MFTRYEQTIEDAINSGYYIDRDHRSERRPAASIRSQGLEGIFIDEKIISSFIPLS